MKKEDLEIRTKQFSLRIIRLVNSLPLNLIGKAIANQLVRSGMSVGANYRAACRGRSKAEFTAKLGVVLEEADECKYWLEIIMELGILSKIKVTNLHKEADELTAVFYSTIRSSKNRKC
jgi:four helix bundle protein